MNVFNVFCANDEVTFLMHSPIPWFMSHVPLYPDLCTPLPWLSDNASVWNMARRLSENSWLQAEMKWAVFLR